MNPIPEKLWHAIVALQDHAERVGMRLEQIRFDLPHGSSIAGTYNTGLGPISIVGERTNPDEPEPEPRLKVVQ